MTLNYDGNLTWIEESVPKVLPVGEGEGEEAWIDWGVVPTDSVPVKTGSAMGTKIVLIGAALIGLALILGRK
jgi:LPXTG-motif cell wall-anchored protein